MACKGFLGCLLKLLNFLLTLAGLAMVGYGIYLFVSYKRSAGDAGSYAYGGYDAGFIELGRPLLMTVSLDSVFDKLPKAWFIYVFIAVGVILCVISCFGCIGTATKNGCCLGCYAFLVILLILGELGVAAFLYFDKSWEDGIPTDKTGDFDMIYAFLREHWDIVRWVALGVVVLEALVFLLALVVRAANMPPEYYSDDEYIAPRQQIRQLMLNRPPATGIPVGTAVDPRPARNDSWSARMREKYGLDTSEFTYYPSEANGYQQVPTQPTEDRSRCTIM